MNEIRSIITDELVRLRGLFLREGFDVRLVGGCVRDLLSGHAPKDVDLCTDADPDEQLAIYQRHGIRYVETGKDHGTITVILDGKPYEITSLRLDVATDGRRATVAYTRDWIKDLERRDFTINAMSLTFDGELVDPFNGLKDLREGLVAFVGNANDRIKEDYLRILRWFRFRGRFGMSVSFSAGRAIPEHARGLQYISRERIWSEVSRILANDTGPYIMLEMSQMGISQWIDLPDILFNSPAEEVLEITRNPVTILVWIYGKEAEGILRKWKASAAEIKLARELSSAYVQHKPLDPFYAMAVLGWNREHARELAALCCFDSFQLAVLDAWEIPVLPVNGNDLIAAGVKPGPELGRRLGVMKGFWAKSNYTASKQELLDLFQ